MTIIPIARFHLLITTILFGIFFLPVVSFSQTIQVEIPEPRSYYMPETNGNYWLSNEAQLTRAKEWLDLMAVCDTFGLRPSAYRVKELREAIQTIPALDSAGKSMLDWQITGSVLLFFKHLHQGNIKLAYDEVVPNRDSIYARMLIQSAGVPNVASAAAVLDSDDPEYLIYKRYFNDSITRKDTLEYRALVSAMNHRRYISFIRPREYVWVNIPIAEAAYYRNDSLVLKMRTGVGKPETPTPRFAAYITNIETYPFWNVPHSIAVKEILPMVQADPNYLEENNFEVLDASGAVVPDTALHWNKYDKRNFPYHFRQSTGSDNALGVLKFNLRNPYSVYLHATAWPAALTREYRYLSHGCVRLEKPYELANEMLRCQLNIADLKRGKKGRKPEAIRLAQKVPVFLIYYPVKIVDGNVRFVSDEYHLFK